MVLPCPVINTTQPSTISSPCFACPIRKLQHNTFNQPSEPYASSELSNSSSEMSTEQSASPRPKRSRPFHDLFVPEAFAREIPPGVDRLAKKNKKTGIVDSPQGGKTSAKKKSFPGGNPGLLRHTASVPASPLRSSLRAAEAQLETGHRRRVHRRSHRLRPPRPARRREQEETLLVEARTGLDPILNWS